MDEINSERDAVDYYGNIFCLKNNKNEQRPADFMVRLHEYLIKNRCSDGFFEIGTRFALPLFMSKSPLAASPRASRSHSTEVQFCWICFCTNREDSSAEWVHPCKCSGTVQWAHQKCLVRWVNEKEKSNLSRAVRCPTCLTEYIIIQQPLGFVIGVLHGINEMVKTFCPFLVGGIAFTTLYWAATVYGAVTVLQALGFDEGMHLLETTQPLALIIGLPAIPITLVMSQVIGWDDIVLRYLRDKPLLATSNDVEEADSLTDVDDNNSKPFSLTRTICTGIFLPTVSVIIGKMFSKSVKSNLVRTFLGGLTFLAIKGTLNIILQQNELARKHNKRILDYTEANLQEFLNNRVSESSSDFRSLSSSASMELIIIDDLLLF